MPIRDDGSAITRIVFIAQERKAPKARSRTRKVKQWLCPSCSKPVEADTLLDFENGWHTADAGGRWWIKGVCPHCFNRIQFTKSGAVVIDTPHKPGEEWKPVRKTIIKRRQR